MHLFFDSYFIFIILIFCSSSYFNFNAEKWEEKKNLSFAIFLSGLASRNQSSYG